MGGSNIIGLQKWVGPVPPTYNGSDAHGCTHFCEILYVTLDHKTSHKGQFFEIEMYTSSES